MISLDTIRPVHFVRDEKVPRDTLEALNLYQQTTRPTYRRPEVLLLKRDSSDSHPILFFRTCQHNIHVYSRIIEVLSWTICISLDKMRLKI